MKPRIRVAVIDDHPLFREGVVHLLTSCPDIEVVDQGASAKEAAEIARSRTPDVVVLDISIPGGGLAALETIVATCVETRVLMLTVSGDEADVLKALRLGARGYVVKGVSGPELIQAIYCVFHGDRYLSPTLGAKLLSDVISTKAVAKVESFDGLSCREEEILSLVKLGLSNKEIGRRLNLSDKTIKHYLTSLFQKLHVRSRLEAALFVSPTDRFKTDEKRSVKVA